MNMKKKSFAGMFVKRWLIALAVAIPVCIALTHIICKYVREESAEDYLGAHQSIWHNHNLLNTVGLNDGTDEDLNKERYITLHQMSLARFGSIVIDQDDNLVAPIEDIAIMRTTVVPRGVRICDISYFEELNIEDDLALFTYDYYVNDTEFLPGKCEVYHSGDMRGSQMLYEVDLTPENTEGYTHITEKPGIIVFSLRRSEEEIETLIHPEYHYEYHSGTDHTYVKATKGFMKYIFYEQTYEGYSEGGFHLLSAKTVDIWEIGKTKFITTYVIMVTLSVFVGVIWALISHKNYEKLRFQQIMTNSLAHDLKSPITVVSGYVENIEQNICPEKKEVYISSIGQNVGHMNDIISNIIELSKLENNKKKLEKTPCCGASVINKVLAEYEELIKEKELTVEVLGDGIFMWNEMAITRAFDNLINNAVTHSPKNGIIIINISHKSIEICNSYNNQITVKPEQLFDPFVKGDASRGSSGTGLGLCIANGIFDMHKLDASIELGEMFKVKIEKVNLVKKYRLLIIIATAVILLGAIAGGIYSCWYNSNHITYVATGSGTESDSEE